MILLNFYIQSDSQYHTIRKMLSNKQRSMGEMRMYNGDYNEWAQDFDFYLKAKGLDTKSANTVTSALEQHATAVEGLKERCLKQKRRKRRD